MRLRGCWLGVWVLAALSVFSTAAAVTAVTMTPLLLGVQDAPVPFTGSDGRVHLVYELWVTNFSSGDVVVKGVVVLGDGGVLANLDGAAVASRLQAAGTRESAGTLGKSSQALLFLDVALGAGAANPQRLSHRLALHVSAAPPGSQEMSETGGEVAVDRREVALIGPPLRGVGYISADSCCESTRHRRATLPVNGRVWVAQRFAVDWEQVDSQGRIYAGPQDKLESYAIFGRPALAVADAVVTSVVDGRPEQTPGKYPVNISLEEADGNCVILDLGGGRFAMYAHLQPGSIKVRVGERVKLGQEVGLVGDSGNSVVPHLHFQVMDRASSLGSNGLPYEIREFQVTGKTGGTKAFDEAEEKGTPLAITAFSQEVKNAMPLDQLIISFGAK
ncbi:MAG: M23 family metallopeptidase [Edaphobacter sp.]